MSKATFGKQLQKGPGDKGETTYIMYHGTTMKAARKIKRKGFIRSDDGMLGPGVYISRSFKKAACYPKGTKGQKRVVLKLSVRVGKVKKIDRQGHPLQKSWHGAGYDTAWVPPNCGMVKSGRQENCVWNPKRIKVLSIQSNERESSDDDSSTDEDDHGDEDEDDDDDYDDDHGDDDDVTDSGNERYSSHSSDTSTEEDVNTDDTSSDHSDSDSDSDSDDGDDDDDDDDDDEEASDEGSKSDESSDDLTDTDAGEYSVESGNEDSYESDDDY